MRLHDNLSLRKTRFNKFLAMERSKNYIEGDQFLPRLQLPVDRQHGRHHACLDTRFPIAGVHYGRPCELPALAILTDLMVALEAASRAKKARIVQGLYDRNLCFFASVVNGR